MIRDMGMSKKDEKRLLTSLFIGIAFFIVFIVTADNLWHNKTPEVWQIVLVGIGYLFIALIPGFIEIRNLHRRGKW